MTNTTAAPRTTEQHTTITIPRIGKHWPKQGGHFAGIVAGQNGQPDHLLIIGPEAPESVTWYRASDWAAALSAHGHTDWTLPNRNELAVAYGNCKANFANDWHWSDDQHAVDYAWCQSFINGSQHGSNKGIELRARAVRRFAI